MKGALILMIFVGLAWASTRLLGCDGDPCARLRGPDRLRDAGDLYRPADRRLSRHRIHGRLEWIPEWPFGRGLGVGGNLSDGYFAIDWSAAQQAGSIDGAAESAVGVLLYQMGIAALVPLAFYFQSPEAWRLYASSGTLTQGLARLA